MVEIPGLRVLASGEGWVAIDKESGMLSVPGRLPEKLDSVLTRVRRAFPPAEASHRLDMETSGIQVVAIRKAAHSALCAAFRERQIRKRYVARVWGVPKDAEGEIALPIGRRWEDRPRQCVDLEGGKPSLTRYRVLETLADPPRADVELEPVTGRTHQLRVHLAAIGHPILGDSLYASGGALEASARLLLHAEFLAFPDPLGEGEVSVHAPIPFPFAPVG